MNAEGIRARFRTLWPVARPVVGMVHLPPLPGSPGWGGSMDAVVRKAREDARALEEGGADGVLVENYGDAPFLPAAVPPATVAALAAVVLRVREATGLPVGVNVLRNDAAAALSVAAATGAAFVRVNVHVGSMWTDQGLLEGKAWETLRLRRALDAPVAVLADVLVKHAVPPPGVGAAAQARDAWERGLADALVVSGRATGGATDPATVDEVRSAVPAAPVWVGSGVTPETAPQVLLRAHGVVVGSALQAGGTAGGAVEAGRVRRLVDAVRALPDPA